MPTVCALARPARAPVHARQADLIDRRAAWVRLPCTGRPEVIRRSGLTRHGMKGRKRRSRSVMPSAERSVGARWQPWEWGKETLLSEASMSPCLCLLRASQPSERRKRASGSGLGLRCWCCVLRQSALVEAQQRSIVQAPTLNRCPHLQAALRQHSRRQQPTACQRCAVASDVGPCRASNVARAGAAQRLSDRAQEAHAAVSAAEWTSREQDKESRACSSHPTSTAPCGTPQARPGRRARRPTAPPVERNVPSGRAACTLGG